MTTPNFYLCDGCGKEVDINSRVFIKTGREVDNSGDVDDTGENVDLCSVCWGRFFQKINVDGNIGKELLKYLK